MNDLPALNASEIELLRQFEEELDSEKNRGMVHDISTDPNKAGMHITKAVARKYVPRNQDHIRTLGTPKKYFSILKGNLLGAKDLVYQEEK